MKKLSLRKKTVCAVLVLALCMAAAAAAVSYETYAQSMDLHYKTMSNNIVQTTLLALNNADIEYYADAAKNIYMNDVAPTFANAAEEESYLQQYQSLQDAQYWRIYDKLAEIKAANNLNSLYIIYFDMESKTALYIFDADTTQNVCPIGTWEPADRNNYENPQSGTQGFAPYITDTEKYGWLVTSGLPIFASDGTVIAHVMVDLSMNEVMYDRHEYLLHLCLVLLCVTAVLIFVFIFFVNRAVVKPINMLANAAACYIKGEDTAEKASEQPAFEKLNIHTGDEVENLFLSIVQMERNINTYIQNLTAITAEKEHIEAELSMASKIQASMLPCVNSAFPKPLKLDICADMQPAKEVGGDFYDFFLVNEDTLAVVIADVSGKGMPAALFMVIVKVLIKSNAQLGYNPQQVFEIVNNLLCENNNSAMFVTAFLGYLHIPSGKFTYVNAGHNPPLLFSGGSHNWLEVKNDFVLAGLPCTRYNQCEILLNTNDEVFLYTDGVTEAMNMDCELFSASRLLELMREKKGASLNYVLGCVKRAVHNFAAGAPQSDDITMLMLRYR